MRSLLLVLVLVSAGCLSAPAEGPPGDDPAGGDARPPASWRFGGAWTADHTQADIDAWCEIARAYANECAIMTSFPPQYSLGLISEAECEEARAKVMALPRISAGECAPIANSDGAPSAPTGSSSSARWSLRGTFAPGYSAADLEAVCRAGTGEPMCAMMKSEPPQYAFTFASAQACEDARARIAAIEHARPGACVAPDAPATRPFSLHGSFTAERTPEDMDAVCAVAREHGAECAFMESFPEQFRFGFASEAACASARERLAAIPHTRVGECEPETAGGGSDEPVSSGG